MLPKYSTPLQSTNVMYVYYSIHLLYLIIDWFSYTASAADPCRRKTANQFKVDSDVTSSTRAVLVAAMEAVVRLLPWYFI